MNRVASLMWRGRLRLHPEAALVGLVHHVSPVWFPWPPQAGQHSRCLATHPGKGPKKVKKWKPKQEKQEKAEVEIKQRMTVSELAKAMHKDYDHIVESLLHTSLDLDSLAPHTVLEENWIKEVVKCSGMKFKWAKLTEPKERENKDAERSPPPDPASLRCRPPVVTIMGHVDHGKTTLLDSLRKSQVASTEAGGITQHIGAFLVQLPSGEKITFLDTPGHAAFSSMRARGALATDIVILVVAADDGVMNQTVESIQHARMAKVPIIVAVNKCDKPQAEPARVKRELLSHDLVCEEFGGDVQAIHISALKGERLAELMEATVTLAEVMELKGDPVGRVEGTIIESRTDKGMGPVTTAIVQRGTLRKGCVLVAGKSWAKVRFLLDEQGSVVGGAGPGHPVQVGGWKELPSAGEHILEVESEQRAREVVDWRAHQEEQEKLEGELSAVQAQQREHQEGYKRERESLAHLSWRQRKVALYKANRHAMASRPSERQDNHQPCLPLIIKGDVDGSVQTLLNILETYDSHALCPLELVHFGIGDVTENDVHLAHTFSGTIYGFNISASKSVQQMASKKEVPLKLHRVIYKLIDDLKEELSRKLPPEVTETTVGEASVLVLFEVTVGKKKVLAAGCRVQKGQLDRKMSFRLIRGQETLWEGALTTLKHHKDDVQTVKTGVECGICVDSDIPLSPGDLIVCFQEKQTPQAISWDPGF